MIVRLVTVNSWKPKRTITFDNLPVTIGRSPDAGVRVDDPWASLHHCEIDEAANGTLVIRDLNSATGTLVQGYRIAEALLMPGNELIIGGTRFLVQYERSTTKLPSRVQREQASVQSNIVGAWSSDRNRKAG